MTPPRELGSDQATQAGGRAAANAHSADDRAGADDRPISVRLGQVVPPEDPEDWRRPLTWLAAAGMLAAPIAAFAWFAAAGPQRGAPAEPGTWLLAALVAAGGVVTGTTQRGSWRAFAATGGAALFAAVATVAVGASLGTRTTDAASPALSHATAAGIAGAAGALSVAPLMALIATHRSRSRLVIAPVALGGATAILLATWLMSLA